MRRIGVLTSGGDSPGMNAAVMAVAKSARYYGMSLIGIKRGYNGTLCKSHHIEDDMVELDLDTILDIADQPGTYLRTARCLDFLRPEMRVHAANNIREMGIEGIVVIITASHQCISNKLPNHRGNPDDQYCIKSKTSILLRGLTECRTLLKQVVLHIEIIVENQEKALQRRTSFNCRYVFGIKVRLRRSNNAISLLYGFFV